MENYSYKTKSVLTPVNSKEIISDLEAHTKICNWLDNMIYPPRFFTFDNKYVFIKSMVKNPTGLDTDFYHWLVIRQPDKDIVGEIVSLSGNVNNFFLRKMGQYIFYHLCMVMISSSMRLLIQSP